MSSQKNSAFSPWPLMSSLSMSTWPVPTNNLDSFANSWSFDSSASPRFSSSEPSPTLPGTRAGEESGSWQGQAGQDVGLLFNSNSLDQLAAKLLTIAEDEPPTSASTPSPVTSGGSVESEMAIQLANSRSTPDLEDERSGDSSDDATGQNSRFKTEICRNFKEKGQCLYGNLCQFAHGNEEMRNVGQHNKYKTKRCQKYWIAGYCAYGPRCNFLHSEKEDQVVPKPGPGAGSGLASHRRQSQAQLRKGSAGELSVDTSGGSGDSLPRTTPSCSPPHIKFKLPSTPVPLEILHRPSFGSGRLAAFSRDGEFFWIDIRTQKYV